MGNYELIQGKLSQIELAASKAAVLKNAGSQAATSALIGAVTGSASASTAAPLLLMLNKEFNVYTITAKIENKKIVGQFSYIEELQDKDVIVVIDKEKSEDYQFIYALIEPQTGLLYMADELGQSLKWLKISFLKWFLVGYILLLLLFIVSDLFLTALSEETFNFINFINFIGLIGGIMIPILGGICFFSTYTPFVQQAKKSEKIFELLGFENPKNINMYQAQYRNKEDKKYDGVFEYRKVLTKDPYPKNYFDKLKKDMDA